ncbi:MAG: DUF6502 family protein [Methylotenera sp.]
MSIETPPSVVTAIEYCLKPIARLCIHFGLDYRQLSEMLKNAFVTVAEEEFKIDGKSQNDSRIALLTGVHRKDVRRLLGRAPNNTPPRQQGLVANLIAQWLGMPELLNEEGEPKPIPRNAQPEYPTSFTALAEALTNDIHPRALLDECVSRGIVRITDDDMVYLIAESLVPADDLDDKAHFFAQTIHDHIAAAEHNLSGGQPAFLDRFVWHEGLTEADTKMIAAAAKKAAMTALKQVNNQAVNYKQQHYSEATRPEFKIHFGTFFYSCRSPVTQIEEDPSS